MNIASALRATSTTGRTARTVEGLAYGASAVGSAYHGARSFVSRSDASNMRDASRYAEDLNTSLDSSAKSAGRLSQAIGSVKQNLGAYLKWAAIGGLVGSALRDLSDDADRVVESYYSIGESMARTRKGMHGLIKDTWNLSLMSGRLEEMAARMNMPAEAMRGIFEKLTRSVRTFYGSDGKIRYDLAGDAAMQVAAFSRITGASVEQSVDLYAKLTNQYGKSHRQVVSGMQSISRAGQMVNEELHDMGKDGGLALEDLVGLINDAGSAFDGFALNVEHLAARTSHAIKIGQELGMTYNQAADTAKQMTAIFARPGGYIAFQAGDQLQQEIADTLRGLTDAETRAKTLSQKYGINVAQGRTLDIASSGPNAQMNVMEVMKGTTAGMEKQFTLMQEQARNNALSTDVFKQFVGGQNLSTEQSGDLLQVLSQQGSSFKDWQRRLEMSKKETAADKVVDQSVFVPTMAKEWIKATSGAMKLNIAAGLGIAKGLVSGLKFAAMILIGYGIIKAIMNVKQVVRNLDKLMVKWFDTDYTKKRDFFLSGYNRMKKEAGGAWMYLRSGEMFKDMKSFFRNVSTGIGSLIKAFQNGSARVTIQGYANAAQSRGAAAMRGVRARGAAVVDGVRTQGAAAVGGVRARGAAVYQDLQTRGSAARTAVAANIAAARTGAQQNLTSAQAAYARVSHMNPALPIVAQRRQALEDARAAMTRTSARSRNLLRGVSDYASTQASTAADSTRRAVRERVAVARNAATTGTAAARRIARRQQRLSAVADRRAQREASAAESNMSGGGMGGGGIFASLLGLVGSFSGTAGAGAASMADLAMSTGGMVGGGGAATTGGIAGSRPVPNTAIGRFRNRVRGRGRELLGDVNTAVSPMATPLRRSGRVSAVMTESVVHDLGRGAASAAVGGGTARQRGIRGALTAGRGFASRNATKGVALLAAGGLAYGTYQGFRESVLGEENTGEDGETQRAGGRRYDEEIKEKRGAVEEISNQIDIAKLAGDQATADSFQREYEQQKALLDAMEKKREGLNASDRKRDEIDNQIKKLKKARKDSTSESSKKLLSAKIDALQKQENDLDTELAKSGLSSTSVWTKAKSFASLFFTLNGIRELGSMLFTIGPIAKVWEAAKGATVGVLRMASKLITGPLGRIPLVRAAASKIATFATGSLGGIGTKLLAFVGPKAAKFIPGVGDILSGGLAALMTEGGISKKLFVGVGTAGASLAGRVGGGAAMGGTGFVVGTVAPGVGNVIGGVGGVAVGQGLGSVAASAAAQSYLPDLYDKWFTNDDDIKKPSLVRPEGPSGSMAGSMSDLSSSGVGTVTRVGKDNSAYLSVKISNFGPALDKQQMYNEQRDSGRSGGGG